MAENGGNHDLPDTVMVPVTPAPTRSQTNLASRAPGPETLRIEVPGSDIPQAAAKPPPDFAGATQRRRLTDVSPAAGGLPEPVTWAATEVHEIVKVAAPRRNHWTIGAECLLVLICVLPGILAQNGLEHAGESPQEAPARQPGGQDVRPTDGAAGLPEDPGAAFTTALDDLDKAIEDIPQQSPEHLLRTVSRPGRDCILLWDKDYPAVVYGTPPIHPNSLAANLEACAQAVKQLPR